jgi:DNA-binding response OmpR family regulator
MTGTGTETTILVIDDNVTLAQAFARVLMGAGYRVHISHTAEEGLRMARMEPPDAIILDVRMPFVNGIGFLYRLRESATHSHIPVMVVTGASLDDETSEELRELRAVVRYKPLGVAELLAETSLLLAHRQEDTPGPPREAKYPIP